MTVVVIDTDESVDSDETHIDSITTSTTTTRITDNTNKAPLEGSTTAILSSDEGSSSSLTVAIVLPVIICALFVTALVTFYVWRRKRSRSTVIDEQVTRETSAPEYEPTEVQLYPQESCYAVIPTEREVQDEVTSDGYSAIDEIAAERDETHIDRSYNLVSQTDIQFVKQGYDHVTDSTLAGQAFPDNVYSKVNKYLVSKANEDEGDDSYNKLNSQQTSSTRENVKTVQNKVTVGEQSGYSHCFAGKSEPGKEQDGYSHLNSL